MSTTQTLREPKRKRSRGNATPCDVVEAEEPETAQEWYRRWCREVDEWQKQQGLCEEDMPTMEEIVAIVKKVRAEMYAEEQEQKNAACR